MQVAAARKLLELSDTTDADDLFAIVADPDGDRVAPVPVAREAPIACIFEPVMEALLLDETGDPACRLVQLDKALLNICHLDEPAVEATVDKRRLTAPAEGIAMLDRAVGEKTSLSLQVLNNRLIGFLDVNALVR